MKRGTGRPAKYTLRDGTAVRSVTTILGRFKESGALLQWAFKIGQSGASSLYEKRDEAAEVGTLAHDWIQASIHGEPLPEIPADKIDRVESALAAYREWIEGARMEIIATEVPLVSERYRFGGTIDAVARDNKGRVCLLDWKTSNGVYSDYALQLAAYRQLWDENNPDQAITGGYHLCRFAKEHGDFEHRYWPDLVEAWEMFKLLVPAYELDKQLRERIK